MLRLPAMRPDTPRRLPSFPYVGLHRYFVTICTHTRRSVFVSGAVAATVEQRLRESAERHGFSPDAYCFMPDHVHMCIAILPKHSVASVIGFF